MKINIEVQNLFEEWIVEEDYVAEKTKSILVYYLEKLSETCLKNYSYEKLTLDLVFCDSKMTHELNRDYRNKDYEADIITFAIFADSEPRFVLDGEINLGEIVIALDKVIAGVNRDISKSENKEQELFFLISHGLMHLLGFDHHEESEYNFVIEQQQKALRDLGYDKI